MGMALAVEAWVLSVFGWAWLTVQNLWMPSLLSSLVFYGFLLVSSLNLVICSLFADSRAPRVGYFNTVFGFILFCSICIADTFDTFTFGGETFRPDDMAAGSCCANCNIARTSRALYFADSPLYVMQAGILIGYMLVHLLVAGGQLLSSETRSVWGGSAWGNALSLMLAARFIIVFDGSTLALVPDSVIYVLLFSKPLMTLSIIYWMFLDLFLLLTVLEGIPQLNLISFRVVRGVGLGVSLGFVILSCVVHGVRGMLTPPLFLGLCVVLLGSIFGILEAFLGRIPSGIPSSVSSGSAPQAAADRRVVPNAPRAIHFQHEHMHPHPRQFGMGGQAETLLSASMVTQRQRMVIPASMLTSDTKKVL